MNYFSTTNTPEFQGLPINVGSDGQFFCYDMMLKKIYDRMMDMITRHNKVLFIRFDLRFPNDYSSDTSNDSVSLLFKTLKDFYQYHAIDVNFAWFREQSREKHQHYHCILLLNGNKIQEYYPVLKYVSGVWARIVNCKYPGLVDFCKRDRAGNPVENGIMIRRPSSKALGDNLERQKQQFQKDFARCFYWSSYLCKYNQKSDISPGVRRFGTSQMKKTSDS